MQRLASFQHLHVLRCRNCFDAEIFILHPIWVLQKHRVSMCFSLGPATNQSVRKFAVEQSLWISNFLCSTLSSKFSLRASMLDVFRTARSPKRESLARCVSRVTQDVRVPGFHCTRVTFNLSCCPRHFPSDRVRQAIRRDCLPARIRWSLQFSSLAVFDRPSCFSCPFQTVGTQRSLQLGFVATSLSCANGSICTLLHQPSSAVMRCSETSFVACFHSNVPSDNAHTPWTVRTLQLDLLHIELFVLVWFCVVCLHFTVLVCCTRTEPHCTVGLSMRSASSDTQSCIRMREGTPAVRDDWCGFSRARRLALRRLACQCAAVSSLACPSLITKSTAPHRVRALHSRAKTASETVSTRPGLHQAAHFHSHLIARRREQSLHVCIKRGASCHWPRERCCVESMWRHENPPSVQQSTSGSESLPLFRWFPPPCALPSIWVVPDEVLVAAVIFVGLHIRSYPNPHGSSASCVVATLLRAARATKSKPNNMEKHECVESR